jgi:hypothetical protein
LTRKKVSVTVYLTPRQAEKLKQLKRVTRVPEAERIREAIDMVLAREAQAAQS